MKKTEEVSGVRPKIDEVKEVKEVKEWLTRENGDTKESAQHSVA